MGLLDDAIREHLDLKRARGGDPAEIERMEREALGPVRREPPIGSTRFETIDEPAPRAFQEPEFHEDHLTELEELQELGYHDSTAPHLHPHHEHDHVQHEHLEPHDGFDDLHPEPLEVEQPEPQAKRRFLRRNRPASLPESAAPDVGFPEELPAAQHDLPTEHHDLPTEHHDLPTEHHDLPDHPEPDPYAHEAPEPPAPLPASPPPHLQFDNPPKRPRFTAEPPDLQHQEAEEPEPPAEPVSAAPPPPAPPAPAPPAPAPAAPAEPAPDPGRSAEPPADVPDAETTEFDVQKHLAEAPHEDDEDMLEETPDFLQDTPEHDRLWFEQRPPKDFDFNG